MLHLTPALLENSYELLRLTPPFKRWKLPHADDLEFRVTNHADRFGHYDDRDGKAIPNIAVSSRHVKTLLGLFELLAHEMCHLYLHRQGRKWEHHGPSFQRLADQVCRHHGFNREQF